MTVLIFITCLAMCFLAGKLAAGKGRSFGGYFVLSLILTPLVGLIAAAVAKPDIKTIEQQQIDSGEMTRCDRCSELIKREAVRCKHCGAAVKPRPPESAPAPIKSRDVWMQ